MDPMEHLREAFRELIHITVIRYIAVIHAMDLDDITVPDLHCVQRRVRIRSIPYKEY